MFVNDDILSLGSENTETITIENNRITVGYHNILLYNEEETLCHSDIEAIIKLKNGIGGEDSVIFKNEDSKNGSFKLELGSAGIEANEMNIESNVTLLLSINSEGLIGGLEGYDDDSELNITDGKKLTIGINKKNVKNIGMGHSYTVVSNFRNL